jgi:two-component system, LytTR family, response regulator
MIHCVIIEDEHLAQQGLIKLINKTEKLQLISVFDEVNDFENFIKINPNTPIQLIFLDVELPKKNGIEFLKTSNIKIPVIITTAYHQYAVEGYALSVMDYLLKPIDEERFLSAIAKTEQYISYLNFKESNFYCYIKSDKAMERVDFMDILYIEAMRNYVIYYLTDNRRLVSYSSLKNVEVELPPNQFIRIQKSFIVNTKKISKIEKGSVFINELEIKINRENKNEIIQKLLDIS